VLARGTEGATLSAGFRPLGNQAVRVDLVERIARGAHDARQGRRPFAPDPALATSVGLEPATTARLMAELGFHPVRAEGEVAENGVVGPRWVWRGRPSPKVAPVAPGPDNAFAALAEWRRLG
jgi:ATP-dependent RNA helicase SUPV3L1/SUV3